MYSPIPILLQIVRNRGPDIEKPPPSPIGSERGIEYLEIRAAPVLDCTSAAVELGVGGESGVGLGTKGTLEPGRIVPGGTIRICIEMLQSVHPPS